MKAWAAEPAGNVARERAKGLCGIREEIGKPQRISWKEKFFRVVIGGRRVAGKRGGQHRVGALAVCQSL